MRTVLSLDLVGSLREEAERLHGSALLLRQAADEIEQLRFSLYEHDEDDLGDRLRRLRVRAGLTAREVGVALGIHPSNIYNWEHGVHTPTHLEELAQLYGVEKIP